MNLFYCIGQDSHLNTLNYEVCLIFQQKQQHSFYMNSQLSVVLLIRLFDPLMIISRLSPALLIYHLDKCFRSIEICLLTIKVHINVENRNKNKSSYQIKLILIYSQIIK